MSIPKDVQIPPPKLQFFDAAGKPLAGGKVFTYAAGTTNKIVTYTDATGLTANTNPIILDARGECSVWVPPLDPSSVDAAPPGPPGPPGPQGPPGANGLLSVSITLTPAEIVDLINTPILVLAGQGTDTVIVPVVFTIKYTFDTAGYTSLTGELVLQYTSAPGGDGIGNVADSVVANRSDDGFAWFTPWAFGNEAITGDVANEGVYITCNEPIVNPGTAAGTVEVTMWYEVQGSGAVPAGVVSSVTCLDGSLSIAPTTGDVIAAWNPNQTTNVNGGVVYSFANSNSGTGAYNVVAAVGDTGVGGGIMLLATSSGFTPGGALNPNDNAVFNNGNGLLLINNSAGAIKMVTGGDFVGNERLTILGAPGTGSVVGNIGVGIDNPTARFDIKAGSATAGTAPIKLHEGPLLTVPESGALEAFGSQLYFTTPGPVRHPLIGGAGSSGLVQIINRKYISTLGAGPYGNFFYNFATLGLMTANFDYDPDALGVITYNNGTGLFDVNAACLMEITAIFHGSRLDALPSLIEVTVNHNAGTEYYGNLTDSPSTNTSSEVAVSVTTGPMSVAPTDAWGANVIMYGPLTTFSRIQIKQLELAVKVYALL